MMNRCRNGAARRWWLLPAAFLTVLGLAGCAPKQQLGDKKEDWAKTGPPPQYHGPGQPGGPASGPAASGNAAAPQSQGGAPGK